MDQQVEFPQMSGSGSLSIRFQGYVNQQQTRDQRGNAIAVNQDDVELPDEEEEIARMAIIEESDGEDDYCYEYSAERHTSWKPVRRIPEEEFIQAEAGKGIIWSHLGDEKFYVKYSAPESSSIPISQVTPTGWDDDEQKSTSPADKQISTAYTTIDSSEDKYEEAYGHLSILMRMIDYPQEETSEDKISCQDDPEAFVNPFASESQQSMVGRLQKKSPPSSVLVELILGHLRYLLTDVPPQPNSPPDNVFCPDQLNLITF